MRLPNSSRNILALLCPGKKTHSPSTFVRRNFKGMVFSWEPYEAVFPSGKMMAMEGVFHFYLSFRGKSPAEKNNSKKKMTWCHKV